MRPNNLAAIRTGVASLNAAQHAHRRTTPESGFDEWAAAFRLTAAQTANCHDVRDSRDTRDGNADALTILHCFFTHEAVKLLQFLCRNRFWFFTLVAEAARQHGTSSEQHITRADIVAALVVLQNSQAPANTLPPSDNPIFAGDATDRQSVDNLLSAAAML